MHIQYMIEDELTGVPINDADIIRITSYLNNNGYSVSPGIGSSPPVIDVVYKSTSSGIMTFHIQTLKQLGYKLTQIDEAAYKAAFKK